MSQYEPQLHMRKEAEDAIIFWAPLLVQKEPEREYSDEWLWDIEWLDKAYLVCKDKRTLVCMKILAIGHLDLDIVGILTLSIKYGFALGLYVEEGVIREFSNRNITTLTRLTVATLYASGYVDTQLKYTLGFETQYAVAFIAAGGVLSYVAQMYDENLVFRFLRGPSLQVSEYGKGDKLLHTNEEGREMFLTADCVSPSEVSQLLGHIPTGSPATEMFLWPHPVLMEEESSHVHGSWSPGAYAILENLKAEILSGHYKWRNRKQWISYFRAGNVGKFAPEPGTTPVVKDFEDAEAVISRAYPINWNRMMIRDIKLPEMFEPIEPRD
ncbi:hypothetical protein C8R44DRAFT_884183 [Mycena epipterygia]|nr:hypothetical protein C8R44DRAFT_884183 [Mycena epipterygia]